MGSQRQKRMGKFQIKLSSEEELTGGTLVHAYFLKYGPKTLFL